MTQIPLEEILNYKGNRYEIARACMEYVKCIRYLHTDEVDARTKDVLIAIKNVLNGKINYTADKFQIELHQDEVEFLKDFNAIQKEGDTAKSIPSSSEEDGALVPSRTTSEQLEEILVRDEPYKVEIPATMKKRPHQQATTSTAEETNA